MTDLSEDVVRELAGGDVSTVTAARDVPVVTAADIEQARQAAEEAERTAAESEKNAIAGTVEHGQAVSDSEAARFARLRVALTQRKAERHSQAERIRQLDAVGQEAVKHAALLKDLRDSTLTDLASIEDLRKQIAKRVRDWNAGLTELIARGAALKPEPLRPGSVPSPSSAHVYAGGTGATNAVLVVRNQVLTPIRHDHPDGEIAAIDSAHRETRQHHPAVRLIRGENGVVIPLGRDPGGHLQRKIDKGELHELSLAEKRAYWRGEH